MVEAKLLRKKLKNGLIVDKWDLVTIIEKQQAEIEALKAKTLTDEEILQDAENMFGTYFFESIDDPYWIEFARAILRKAQEK
jgi:hypothetical protein